MRLPECAPANLQDSGSDFFRFAVLPRVAHHVREMLPGRECARILLSEQAFVHLQGVRELVLGLAQPPLVEEDRDALGSYGYNS